MKAIAIIASDTYPPHEKMTGIVGTNEQVPVPADYAAPIVLSPELGLAECDSGERQVLVFGEAGTITAAANPELCLTAGEDTRMGRGGTSQHQIKALTLETCDEERAAYQRWRTRPSDD